MATTYLSNSEIEKAIEEFSLTKEGKQEIESRLGKGKRFVARFEAKDFAAEATKEERARMKTMAQDMARILYKHITQDTHSQYGDGLARFPSSAIIIGNLVKVGNSGDYKVDISFDGSALRRESLEPDLYPDGLNDIVQLFVKGYSASGSVWGEWHGDKHWGLRHRSPNDFMNKAVEEFNNKYTGAAFAALEPPYDG